MYLSQFLLSFSYSLPRNYVNDFDKDGELKAKLGYRNFPITFLKSIALSLNFVLFLCIFPINIAISES